MGMRTDYYVYGLFADEICFYVGKGCEDRKYEHFRDFNNRNKAVSPSMYYKSRHHKGYAIIDQQDPK